MAGIDRFIEALLRTPGAQSMTLMVGTPVELVVNSVTKNHIHGYISEPKYRAAELATMAAQSAGGVDAAAPTSAPPLRKRLPAPTH